MMQPSLAESYNSDFYDKFVEGMTSSAREVLGIVYRHFRPASVIDVGCGRGAWLSVAESLGTRKLRGIDGTWVKKADLLSPNIDFTPVNFDHGVPQAKEEYDLCISLEVAEHVEEKDAEAFVNLLCKASRVVLFGAAVRHQGGVNHINEQWQSYWVALFRQKGYECFDVVRGEIWNNDRVDWWYRQNTFLFCHKSCKIDLDKLRLAETVPIDIIHPLNYERQIYLKHDQLANPDLELCLKCVKRYLVNTIRTVRDKVLPRRSGLQGA